MFRKIYNMNLILVVAMLTLLVLAFAWDRLAFTTLVRQGQNFEKMPAIVWIAPLGDLVQMGALLVLAWFVAFSPIRRAPPAIVYLVLGLLIVFSQVVTQSGIKLPEVLVSFLSFDARLIMTASLIAMIGLVGLVWPKDAPKA